MFDADADVVIAFEQALIIGLGILGAAVAGIVAFVRLQSKVSAHIEDDAVSNRMTAFESRMSTLEEQNDTILLALGRVQGALSIKSDVIGG